MSLQAILIQVHRRANPSEEESCKKVEDRYLHDHGKPKLPDNFNILETNSWFIIRETTAGPEISEIFCGLPHDKAIYSRKGTRCVLVNSLLYDIGGHGSIHTTRNCWSSDVRRLDIRNQKDGWKSKNLPLYCTLPTAAVCGNLIYLLPGGPSFKEVTGQPKSTHWACVYDTVNQIGRVLDLPPNCEDNSPALCIPMEGDGGVLVPVDEACDGHLRWFMHKQLEWQWEELAIAAPFPQLHGSNHPHAVSNGILYVFGDSIDTGPVLHTYEISKNLKFLGLVRLPNFNHFDFDEAREFFIVPVRDYELCFLWHRRPSINQEWEKSSLYYAKVRVNLAPVPAAMLLEEAILGINAVGIINCLPCPFDVMEEAEHHHQKRLPREPEGVDGLYYYKKLRSELQRLEFTIRAKKSLIPEVFLSRHMDASQLPPKKLKRDAI